MKLVVINVFLLEVSNFDAEAALGEEGQSKNGECNRDLLVAGKRTREDALGVADQESIAFALGATVE